jgi:hypothetical protein
MLSMLSMNRCDATEMIDVGAATYLVCCLFLPLVLHAYSRYGVSIALKVLNEQFMDMNIQL